MRRAMTLAGNATGAFMKTETCIVILGLDADKKPRAAKFSESDEKAVMRAAAAQGLKIGRPKTDEAMELALRLVDGRIYASGKGLLPLVNAATYDQLLKLLQIEEPKIEPLPVKPKAAPGKPVTASVLIPDPFFKIAVGSTVLCPTDKGKDRSWWECTVTALGKDSLTVKWTHYPTLKPFIVKRALVALLPSKS
jgi:hypothetical protein